MNADPESVLRVLHLEPNTRLSCRDNIRLGTRGREGHKILLIAPCTLCCVFSTWSQILTSPPGTILGSVPEVGRDTRYAVCTLYIVLRVLHLEPNTGLSCRDNIRLGTRGREGHKISLIAPCTLCCLFSTWSQILASPAGTILGLVPEVGRDTRYVVCTLYIVLRVLHLEPNTRLSCRDNIRLGTRGREGHKISLIAPCTLCCVFSTWSQILASPPGTILGSVPEVGRDTRYVVCTLYIVLRVLHLEPNTRLSSRDNIRLGTRGREGHKISLIAPCTLCCVFSTWSRILASPAGTILGLVPEVGRDTRYVVCTLYIVLRVLHLEPNTRLSSRDNIRLGSRGRDQRCGSVTFWNGSGSADPYISLTDPDLDPAIFVSELQDSN